jgi:hypothetical protein
MPIGMPWPTYGYLYDSNGDIIVSGALYLTSGVNTLTITSNSGGKYVGNIMNYAYSGCTFFITSKEDGEKSNYSFKVVVSDRGKKVDTTLTEAMNAGNICINTTKKYGNNLYMFTPYGSDTWLKTSEESY